MLFLLSLDICTEQPLLMGLVFYMFFTEVAYLVLQ